MSGCHDRGYQVDLAEMLATVDDLAGCGEGLEEQLRRVTTRVAALHGSWEGRAALAQVDAQADWEAGFEAMRAGLAAMRAAAATAHGNYSAAIDANVRMWDQVR